MKTSTTSTSSCPTQSTSMLTSSRLRLKPPSDVPPSLSNLVEKKQFYTGDQFQANQDYEVFNLADELFLGEQFKTLQKKIEQDKKRVQVHMST